MEIIDIIEQYRKEKRVHKADLCGYASINKNMYAKYMKGAKIPYNVVKDMLTYLNKQIVVTDKFCIYNK